jgi:hypothetical protein
VSKPRTLFNIQDSDFAISRDVKRFLIFKGVEGQPPPTITLITNWSKLLQK